MNGCRRAFEPLLQPNDRIKFSNTKEGKLDEWKYNFGK